MPRLQSAELAKLKEFQKYDEVGDLGQDYISSTWVITDKGGAQRAGLVARGLEEEAETSRKHNAEKSVNLVDNAESDEEIEFICEVRREQEVQKDDQISLELTKKIAVKEAQKDDQIPLEHAEKIADQSEVFQITLDNSNTVAEIKCGKKSRKSFD